MCVNAYILFVLYLCLRCVQGFGGETWGKETTGETQV